MGLYGSGTGTGHKSVLPGVSQKPELPLITDYHPQQQWRGENCVMRVSTGAREHWGEL